MQPVIYAKKAFLTISYIYIEEFVNFTFSNWSSAKRPAENMLF